MFHFQRLVVPLSMSDADAGLLRYASLVTSLGVTDKVHFVHVITPVRSPAGAITPGEVRSKMEQVVRSHFAEANGTAAIECHAIEGTRIDRLVAFSIEKRADLILLGSGKSRTRRRSLAERLAMITSCSVWAVPDGSPDRIEKILAPVDFSDHSADSLGVAAALARLQDLDAIEALHAASTATGAGGSDQSTASRESERRGFSEFLARANGQGIFVDPVIQKGSQPADAILRHARHSKADLIVMSTRGIGPKSENLLGSATAQMLAEAPMPVLAVRHFDPHAFFLGSLGALESWTRADARMR